MRYSAAKRKSDPFSRTSWQYLMHHNQPLDALNILNNILEQENLGRDKVKLLMNRAICYERLGNFEKAEQKFKKLRASNPNHPKSALSYAKFLEDRGRDSEALELYEFLHGRKHLFDTPDYRKQNIGSSIQIGYERVLKRLDQAKKAKQLRAEYKKTRGPDERILLQEAFDEQKQGDLKKAQQLFDTCCQHFPLSVNAWLGYGRCLYLQEKFHDAVALFKKLKPAIQNEAKILLAWGRCLQEIGVYPAAIDKFKQGLRLYPQDDDLQIALLRCYECSGDMLHAKAIALKLAPASSSNPKVLSTVAQCLVSAGDVKQARQYLERDKKLLSTVSVAQLYARCLDESNEPQEAVKFLAKLYQEQPRQADIAIAYASHLQVVGRYSEALEVFTDAAKKNSHNTDIIIAHAYCLSHLNSHEAAISLIKKVYSTENKDYTIGLCYSKCLEINHNYDEALNVLMELHDRFPNNAAVAKEFAQCLSKNIQQKTGNIDKIRALYESFPQNIHIILAYVTVLRQEKQHKHAKAILLKHKDILLSIDPDVALTTVKYLEQMGDLQDDDVTSIRQRFPHIPKIAMHFRRYEKSTDAKTAESLYLQTPHMAVEYAGVLENESKSQDLINFLTQAYQKFPFSHKIAIEYLHALKHIHNFNLLHKIIKEAAQRFPQVFYLQLRYVELLSRQNEFAKAAELLTHLKTHYADNVQLQMQEAYFLKQEGNWMDALVIIEKLYERLPNNPFVLGRYTSLLLKMKNYRAVITLMEKVFSNFLFRIDKNPMVKKFCRNYITSLIKIQDYSKAIEQLSILRQHLPQDLQFAREYALCLEQSGDYGAALAQFQELREKFPKDYQLTLQYAICLDNNNMHKAAFELLSELKAIFPNSHSLAIAYGFVLANNGKHLETIAYFKKLLLKYPDDYRIICHLAYEQMLEQSSEETITLLKEAMVKSKGILSTVRVGLKLADIYSKSDQFQLAEDLYKQLLQDYPSDLSIISDYMRFLIYTDTKYSQKTDKYINKYIQAYPFYADFRLHKLAMLLYYQRISQAAEITKECIKEFPRHQYLFKKIQEIYATYSLASPAILKQVLCESTEIVAEQKTQSSRMTVDDPHNGILDLRAGTIKMIEDPHLSFTEHPIRIFRVILAHIKYDMQLDEKIPAAIKATVHLLRDYKDPGHLADYMLGLFSCHNTLRMFTLLVELGLWDVLFLQSNGLSTQSFPQEFLQEIKTSCKGADQYFEKYHYSLAHELLSSIVDKLVAAAILLDKRTKATTLGQLKLFFTQNCENITTNLPVDVRCKEKIKEAQLILHHAPEFSNFFKKLVTSLKIEQPAIASVLQGGITERKINIDERKFAHYPLSGALRNMIPQCVPLTASASDSKSFTPSTTSTSSTTTVASAVETTMAKAKASSARSQKNTQKKRRLRKSNKSKSAPIATAIEQDKPKPELKPQSKLDILLSTGDQQISEKKFIEAKKSYTEAYRLCTNALMDPNSLPSIEKFEDLARVQDRFHDFTEDDQLFSYFMKKFAHTLIFVLPKLNYLLASKFHHFASFVAQMYFLSFLHKDHQKEREMAMDQVEIKAAESDRISILLDVEKLIFYILQTVAIDVTDFNSLQISKRFKKELKIGESLLTTVMTWIKSYDPLRKPLQDTEKVVQTLQTQTLTTVKKIAAMPLGQTFNKTGNNNALAVNVLKYILKNFKLLLPQFIKTDGLQDLFLQPKPLALLDVVNVSLKFIQQIDKLQWSQSESKDIPGKECFALATLLFNIMQYRHYYEAEFMKQINTHMPNTITIADQVPAEFWRILLMAAFKQGVASPRLAILATLLCSKTKGELLTLKLTGDIIAASSSTKAQEYYQRAAEYKLNFTSSATQALSSVNEMLAQCHSLCQLKEYDKAAALCAEALSVYPYHFKLHIMQAEIYSRIDPDKALDMCNEILQIQPNEFDTHKIMGNSYLQKGEYQKAEAQYLRILKNEAKLGGKENDTVLRLAEVYVLAECYVQAIRTYLTLFLPSTATFVAILDDKPIPAAVLDIEGICAFLKHKASSKIIKTLLEQEKLAIVKIGECLQQLDYKAEAQAISQLIPATETPATHTELVLKRKDSLFVLPGADSSAASSSSPSTSGTSSTLQAG